MWNTLKLILDGSAAIPSSMKESRRARAEVEAVAGGFAGSHSGGNIWVEEKPAWHLRDPG